MELSEWHLLVHLTSKYSETIPAAKATMGTREGEVQWEQLPLGMEPNSGLEIAGYSHVVYMFKVKT